MIKESGLKMHEHRRSAFVAEYDIAKSNIGDEDASLAMNTRLIEARGGFVMDWDARGHANRLQMSLRDAIGTAFGDKSSSDCIPGTGGIRQ